MFFGSLIMNLLSVRKSCRKYAEKARSGEANRLAIINFLYCVVHRVSAFTSGDRLRAVGARARFYYSDFLEGSERVEGNFIIKFAS